jgi:hypothetical protein
LFRSQETRVKEKEKSISSNTKQTSTQQTQSSTNSFNNFYFYSLIVVIHQKKKITAEREIKTLSFPFSFLGNQTENSIDNSKKTKGDNAA